MPKLWLPQHVGERYEITKRLRELNVFVAGAEQLDVSHLRDILQKEEHKAGQVKPKEEVPRLPKEQVQMGLRDYIGFLKARREGRRRVY
jgi:hypothetical protein